jgi:DNA-directed RNA polymerase specialized sigma24 family protein
MKSILELNEAEKLSIRRRKLKGTPINEIAEIIGCTAETVKQVLKHKPI